jgi:transcriptional regulator with GAF, ATPase, and Fis domain
MELQINTKNITIPDHIIGKFQSIVNIMADIIRVPAALIMKIEQPYIDVFCTSESSDNPFKEGDRYRLAGVYCEKVIETKKKLLVPNALKDKEWESNPDLEYGMVSYLGFPLMWPNGEVFGTICVSDTKENDYGEKYEMLMLQFKELVEAHFALLYQNYELQDKTNRLQESLQDVRSLYEDLKSEKKKTKSLRKALEDKFGLGNIVGKNPQMQAIYELIEDISQSDSTVLIQGESGTGKELIARAIHLLSPRKEKPFIIANCSAYVQTLLESELFGHEKGAFTGAIRRKRGRFELADGGTIFLDEIGEIPPTTQLLLLRVLQEKKFERVGAEDTIKVDVRVIAATNRNLNQEMMEGRFREDLYYRLNVIPINVPPLRERKDDVPLLAKHFLEIYSNANGKHIRGFSEEVMQIFMDYDWLGNVRELQNIVEHAVILAKGEVITEIDLPSNLKVTYPQFQADTSSLKEIEKNLILKVLKETEGNKYQAAKKLEITRSTLYGKLRKHGIMASSND